MADLSFSQAERRSFTVPLLLGLAVLAAVVGFFFWRTPMRVADVSIPHVATLPTHTVFPSATRIVGMQDPAEDVFYVLATVRIHNNLHVPIFVKDITGTLVAPDETEITASAVEKNELSNLFTAFPKLKPLSSTPLYRETTIEPGADGEGMVILNFPVDQDAWNKRKSASITLDLYHQGSVTTAIPSTAPASK